MNIKRKIISLGVITTVSVIPFLAVACSDDHEDEFALEVENGVLARKNVWKVSLKKDVVSAADLIELLNSKIGSTPNYFNAFENGVEVKDKDGNDVMKFTLGTYVQANGLTTALWLKQTLEEKFTEAFNNLSDDVKKTFTNTSF